MNQRPSRLRLALIGALVGAAVGAAAGRMLRPAPDPGPLQLILEYEHPGWPAVRSVR